MGDYANRIMHKLAAKDPGEPEFHQAVHEVAGSVELASGQPRAFKVDSACRTVRPPAVVKLCRGPTTPGRPGEPRVPCGTRTSRPALQGRPGSTPRSTWPVPRVR
jgi:hypothetical protein